MIPPAQSFYLRSYAAGSTRDARAVVLAPMTAHAAGQLGTACAAMDPWHRYGIKAERLATSMATTGGNLFCYEVHVGGELAGGVILQSPWLLGPYLQLLAVLPTFQGTGVGAAILAWMEAQARASQQRNIWLCVSGFNTHARAFYLAQGWQEAARLPDLVADDVDEVMLRKRLVY